MSAGSDSFRIHFFGTARFELGGAPWAFTGPPRALPLLAYLLLHRESALARDTVAFALWPDEPEETARANLRRHLHMVQRALPPRSDEPWIQAQADALRWNPGPSAWFDVAEFESLCAAEQAAAAAVSLYAGDLLENLYDDWVIEQRNRLRGMYMHALDRLVMERRHARDFHGAAAYAERMLACDPWREDAVRQFMIARYEIGDRSGALRRFEEFRQRLRVEMEVDPLPETIAVRDAILRGDPMPGSTPQRLREAPERTPRSSLPFVGRAAETAFLRERWNRAISGNGSLVLCSGEAGIGKSRLAADFALAAEREGARVLSGATSAPESTPYQSLIEALRFALPLIAASRIEPLWLAAIAQLLPELRAVRSDLPAVQPGTPDRDRLRLFEALATTFAALARSRPLLLILEDLHWAGDATIAALEYLAPRFLSERILAIATYREEETQRAHPLRALRRRLAASGAASHVTPAPLSPTDLEQMLAAIPSLAPRAGALATTLHAQSEGNPLFAAEIVRDWADSQPGASRGAATPALQEAIAARLGRLSPDARACAEVAAIAGRGFDIDLVREVSGWPEEQILRALDELLDRAVVRESSGRAHYGFAFRHQLIQQALYEGIASDVLLRRHRRIAHAIEELYADRRDELCADLARHYDLGNEPERAALWYLEAGQRAADVFAHAEAEAALTRGLELARDEGIRLEFVALREDCRNHLGERAGQRADIHEYERLAQTLSDGDALFDATLRRVKLERSLGERDREAEAIARLHELAGADPLKRARALLTDAEYASLTGEDERAVRQASEAMALFGDRPDAVECLCLLAELAAHRGLLDETRAYLDRARTRASAHSTLPLIARATMAAGQAALIAQRFAEAVDLSVAAEELYRAMGDREGEADALGRHASAALRLWNFEESRRANARAAAIFEVIGKRQGLAVRRVNETLFALRLGLFDRALEAAMSALALFNELDDLRGRTVIAVNLSALELWRGNSEAAKKYGFEAIDLARKIHNPTMESAALANLGAAERELGELEAAIGHMRAGLELRKGLSRPGDNLNDLADLALAYLRAGDVSNAHTTADEMLAVAGETGEGAMWPQYVFWVGAQVYGQLGDSDRADTLCRQAVGALDAFSQAVPDDALVAFRDLWFNREIERLRSRPLRPKARRSSAR